MEDIFRCAARAQCPTSEIFRIEDRMYNVELGTDLLDGNVVQLASHADILEEVDTELCSKQPTPQAARASASSLTSVTAMAFSPLLNDAR